MKLIVLGSSSSGNGYILDAGDSALLIECGVRFPEVKRALGYNISKVVGCLLSHAHGDHAKYVAQYLSSGIKVYTNDECMTHTGQKSHNWQLTSPQFKIGEWEIQAHSVVHDVKCEAFLIRHKGNTVCFVTDTHYVPFTFKGLNNIIIECNYDGEILETRAVDHSIPMSVRNRVLSSHISLETCRDWLLASDLSKVNNIVLIHLSDGNSHAVNFKNNLQAITGKPVHIARPGLEVNLSKTPF